MSPRHPQVVTLCFVLLASFSLAFVLAVPTAVQQTAHGDDPGTTLPLDSPELLAWQAAKARKLVEVAEIYASMETADQQVQVRFPGLPDGDPERAGNGAAEKDPVVILEDALTLEPGNWDARLFLAELCIRRDALGTLSRTRQAWLAETLSRLVTLRLPAECRPRAASLVRCIEAELPRHAPHVLATLRTWWARHGEALRRQVQSSDAEPAR